jgi:hypothetical protein
MARAIFWGGNFFNLTLHILGLMQTNYKNLRMFFHELTRKVDEKDFCA